MSALLEYRPFEFDDKNPPAWTEAPDLPDTRAVRRRLRRGHQVFQVAVGIEPQPVSVVDIAGTKYQVGCTHEQALREFGDAFSTVAGHPLERPLDPDRDGRLFVIYVDLAKNEVQAIDRCMLKVRRLLKKTGTPTARISIDTKAEVA